MDFTKFNDINQFYKETGISISEAPEYLIKECKKLGLPTKLFEELLRSSVKIDKDRNNR